MDVLRNYLVEGLKVGFVGKVKVGFQRSEVGGVLRKAGAVDDVCYLRGEGVYAGWKQKAG
jgi:hypothetical protein